MSEALIELREAADGVIEMGYEWTIPAENLRPLLPKSCGRFIVAADPYLISGLLHGLGDVPRLRYVTRPYHGALNAAIEALLPDELFGEVMQGMVDSAWLRERAETIQASGGPDSNAKAAALLEAADAADGAATSGSPDAAP